RGPTIDGRAKPDITGFDATSSPVYGSASGWGAGFRGTSASAPHVSGAAALVLQANPSFAPAQVQSFLEGRAISPVPLGPGGKDNGYGAGRLWLGTAPLAALAASYSSTPPTSWSTGQTQSYAITLTNTGSATW